jgi:hypothetical protein
VDRDCPGPEAKEKIASTSSSVGGIVYCRRKCHPREACVDSLLADSFIKAAKAISAGSVWQVVKYAGRESQCRIQDPKRSFSLGPGTYSRAIRAIAAALVQRSWFLGASSGEPVFMRTQYRAREYPGPMQWERGESPPNPGIDHTATERWIGDMSLFNRILTVCLRMRGSLKGG